MRSNVLTGGTPFRRAYIRSVIDEVEVDDDEIRIWGRKGVLERLVAASGGSGPAGVPSSVCYKTSTGQCHWIYVSASNPPEWDR
jgi:site-specific DNA recombinase